MYYNRLISTELAAALLEEDKMQWLFNFVKQRKDLDFLIGQNSSTEWISVYRGLSSIIQVTTSRNKLIVTADKKYKAIAKQMGLAIYTDKNTTAFAFQDDLEKLLDKISKDDKFDRYYNNKKEGYYQNILSRKYGINSLPFSDFVVIDKEMVVGYEDEVEKMKIFGGMQQKYKTLLNKISSTNPKRFGSNLGKKAIGSELDFLAWKSDGTLLLIEYKHGTNTSGIYLSPLQIGLYSDVFECYSKDKKDDLFVTLRQMVEQKQKLGLIHADWKIPSKIESIRPMLLISEFNPKSTGLQKYREILKICREELRNRNFLHDIEVCTYSSESDEMTMLDTN